MVGSLFSWKSLLTNRSTSDDYYKQSAIAFMVSSPRLLRYHPEVRARKSAEVVRTFPTAASPKSTSLTLLLGFGVFVLVDSDMAREPNGER